MSRKPSAETELRNLKGEYKLLEANFRNLGNQLINYRARALKAEAELAEWKVRFGGLLALTLRGREQV